MWPWNSFILTYLLGLYLVTLQCERSWFGDSCHPFLFDNAGFSIILHLIYCPWGEKLIPTGSAAYCSAFLRFSSGSSWISSWRIWKGSTLEQVARRVMVVIAVCKLIDVRKNSWHPNTSGSESKEMDTETENWYVYWSWAWRNVRLVLFYVSWTVVSLLQHRSLSQSQWVKIHIVQTGLKGLNCLSIFLKDSK